MIVFVVADVTEFDDDDDDVDADGANCDDDDEDLNLVFNVVGVGRKFDVGFRFLISFKLRLLQLLPEQQAWSQELVTTRLN